MSLWSPAPWKPPEYTPGEIPAVFVARREYEAWREGVKYARMQVVIGGIIVAFAWAYYALLVWVAPTIFGGVPA